MAPPTESAAATPTPTPTPTPTGAGKLGTIEPLVLTLAVGITSVFAFMILICLFKLRTTWRTVQQDPRIPATRSTTSNSTRLPHSSSTRLYAAYTPRSISPSPSSSGSGLSFSTRTVVSPHPILGERPEDVKVHEMRKEMSGSRGSGSFPRKQPTLATQSPSSALAMIDPDATMTDPNASTGEKRIKAEKSLNSSASNSPKLSHSFTSGQKPPKSASTKSSGFGQMLSQSLPATIAKGILSDTEKALRSARAKSSSSGSLNSSTSASSSESSSGSVLVMTPAGSLEIIIDQAHIPPAPDSGSSAKRKTMGERARSASSASAKRQQAQLGDAGQVNGQMLLAVPDPNKVLKYSKSTTSSDQISAPPPPGRPRSATATSGPNPNAVQQQYIQQMLAHYRSALESCLGKHDYASIWQPPETVLMDTDTLLAKDGYRTVYEGTLRPATPVYVYCYDAVTAAKLAMRATGSAGAARHNRRKSVRSRQGSASPVGSKPVRPSPLALSMSMGEVDGDESESESEAGSPSSSMTGGGTGWSDRQVVEMWIEEVKMLRLVKDCPYILPLLGISLQPSLSNGGHIYHLSLTPRAKPLADLVFNPQSAWYDDDAATVIYQIALALSYVHARGLKGHGTFSILDVHLLPRLATSASTYSFTSSSAAANTSTCFPYRAVIGGFGIPLASAIRRATTQSTGPARARGHAYARYIDPAALTVGSGSSPIHASPTHVPDAASLADRYALGVLMYELVTRAPVLANVPAPVAVLVAAAKGRRAVVDVRQVLAGARARQGGEAGDAEARRVRVKLVELLTRCWAHELVRRPEWDVVLDEVRAVVPQRAAEGWDWR